MGNGGPYFRGESVNLAGVHCGGVGRCQGVRHEDFGLFLVRLVFLRRFRAAQVVDHPLHDVLHVRRLGPQIGVVHAAQDFHVVLHNHVEDMLHVLEAPGQFRADLVEDDLVLEEENVGVKNGGFLFPGNLDHALAQGPDLHRGRLEGAVKAHQFGIHLVRLNVVGDRFLGPLDLDPDFTEGDAGRNRNALEMYFFRGNGFLNHLRAFWPGLMAMSRNMFNLLRICGRPGLPARQAPAARPSLQP